MDFKNTLEFAQQLDAQDHLHKYQDEFIFPKVNDKKVIYFTGNSLGLQPKSARLAVEQEFSDWTKLGVEGHLRAKNGCFV